MSYSVVLLLFNIIIVECAPKLGNVLFDPLEYEAKRVINTESTNIFDGDDFLENEPNTENTQPSSTTTSATKTHLITTEKSITTKQPNSSPTDSVTKIIKILRGAVANNETPVNHDSIKKTGYDYDENVCKTINGRILCGYNKNPEKIPINDEAVLMPDGCSMRGDRLECGYVHNATNNKNQQLRIDESRSNQNTTVSRTGPNLFPNRMKLVAPSPILLNGNHTQNMELPNSRMTVNVKSNPTRSTWSNAVTFTKKLLLNTTITEGILNSTSNRSHLQLNESFANINLNNTSTLQKQSVGNHFISRFDLLTTQVYLKRSSLFSKLNVNINRASSPTRELSSSTVRMMTKSLPSRGKPGKPSPNIEPRMKLENADVNVQVGNTEQENNTKKIEQVTQLSPTPLQMPNGSAGALRNNDTDKVKSTAPKEVLSDREINSEPSNTVSTETAPTEVRSCGTCRFKEVQPVSNNNKKSLRDLPSITTRRCSTRCVEIDDRIVCYPVKFKSTTKMRK